VQKLDQEEDEWFYQQPTKESGWTVSEEGTFGKDGWSISTSYKHSQKDD
tara:strand:- start:260 stop:406 length:147 start_codon:yes stop_codon:yes gene_type:complete